MRGDVIDVCEVVFDAPSWRAYLSSFVGVAPRYLQLFGGRLCRMAGVDRAAYRAALERDPREAIDLLLASGRLGVDPDAHVAALRAEGVHRQVIHGGPWATPTGNVNDHVAAIAAGRPELVFWAGLSLRDPQAAVREIARARDKLGARGLSIIPFLDQVDPAGPELEPLFAEAERSGLPVWLHSGNHFGTAELELSCWRQLDRLASRHPQLILVAGHGGWPWMTEMVAVLRRHPNVHVESSSYSAAVITRPGSGWDPLLAHLEGPIARQVLFGTTSWVTGQTAGDAGHQLDEALRAQGVPERHVRGWLHDNAARLLGLSPAPTERTAA